MFDKIHYHFHNANYQKCLELSEAYLKENPSFALEFAMLSSFKLALFSKSLYYAQELVNINPTSFNVLMLAKNYAENAKISEALSLMQELLNRQDDMQDELKLELAFFYKNIKKLEEAESIFKEVLSKNSYDLSLWKHYAEIYFMDDAQKSLKAHEELCDFAQDLIKKLENDHFIENKNLNSVNFEDRLHNITKENLNIRKIHDFLNQQILPQKAFLLYKLFKISDSLKLFNSLEEFNQYHAQFWQNYAKVLEFSSNYQAAYNAYQRCLTLEPHATYQFDLAYLLMRMGETNNFEEGKRHYESRLYYAHYETFSAYHYKQSAKAFDQLGIDAFKDKEILVFCEQGFGDTIMYARGLEKLCKVASSVLFAPQSLMYEMFKNHLKILNQNNDTFKNLKVLKNLSKKFDFAVPICSLPFFMDIKLDEIPNLSTPILTKEALIKLKKAKSDKTDTKLSKKKKVGIFYFTPNAINGNIKRNIKPHFLLDSLKELDLKIVSFQIENALDLGEDIENKGKIIKNFNDSANHLCDIDLLISIDSAMAHLALAMQIPTIVLLHPVFDWRWGKFEDPKSYFWPQAKCLVIKEAQEGKSKLQSMIKELLN